MIGVHFQAKKKGWMETESAVPVLRFSYFLSLIDYSFRARPLPSSLPPLFPMDRLETFFPSLSLFLL